MTGIENEILVSYKKELTDELFSILEYWKKFVVNGQDFYGAVDDENKPDLGAEKGVVFVSRILWTFSEASKHFKDAEYSQIATKAFRLVKEHFVDKDNGGVFWSVTHDNKPANRRKQIYGQAFCIYGLSAYVAFTGNKEALKLAKDIFFLIEQYSLDQVHGGYTEAFCDDWSPVDDLRLSEQDANEKKTMNTHLHMVEAYVALYKVWPENILKERIADLLDVFYQRILNKEKDHLHLFLSEKWEQRSTAVSFGHDIEASWLLQECASIIEDEKLTNIFMKVSLRLADAVIPAIDTDGGLWYEYDPAINHWIKEKHWWPQAEGMIGLFNVYEITNEDKYLERSIKMWEFVKNILKDKEEGEWFWGINSKNDIISKGKAGFWKCPYHNGRACMEIIQRINNHLS